LTYEYAMSVFYGPVYKIVMSVSPFKHMRFEPEFAINFLRTKEFNIKLRTIYYGLGIFGMIQKQKMNIYGGARFGLMKSINRDFDYNTGSIETGEAVSYSLEPVIGAEYLFGNHFSVGAEMGVNFYNVNTYDYPNTGGDIKISYILTDTGVFFRYYF
jgi:hypothetical protein